MDDICGVVQTTSPSLYTHVGGYLPPNLLYVILGPTASGKTKLGVALAETIDGEIISIDSRQVYRGMDIGTGKDLQEYKHIPYHLIDICDPKQRYDVTQFQQDFHRAYRNILSDKKNPIAVGGTGLYMQSLFTFQPYMHVPVNITLREKLAGLDKDELIQRIHLYRVPDDFQIDFTSHKRLIRAVEIMEALQGGFRILDSPSFSYPAILFGINPTLETRRKRISDRLTQRLEGGLEAEVRELLSQGLTHDDLQYFGLEYKYTSLYIQGRFDRCSFFNKLETEIHRYAKRQMTFFRKMEKDGLSIHWLRADNMDDQLEEVLHIITNKKG